MKKNLIFVALCLSLFAVGCGKDNSSSSNSVAKSASTPSPASGPCTTIGNIRSFEVTCLKEIESYLFHDIVIGAKSFFVNATINGVRHSTSIDRQERSLTGSESTAESLDLVINFTDSTFTSVTLHL